MNQQQRCRITSREFLFTCVALGARMVIAVIVFAMVSLVNVSAGSSTLGGRVMGSNGRPLGYAAIELFRYGSVNPDTIITAATTGAFSLEIPKNGLYRIRISGLQHEPVLFPFVCDVSRREEIQVTLAPTQLPRRIDSVCAIGSFNGYSITAGRRMEMKNGAYRCTVKELDRGDTWQVLVYGDSSWLHPVRVCGISADGYSVSEGRISARIEPRGAETELVFDAGSVPTRSGKVMVTAGNSKLQSFITTAIEIAEQQERYTREMEASLSAHTRTGGTNADFNVRAFSDRMGISAYEQRLKEQIRMADDTLTERLLYIAYLTLPEGNKDNGLMERALRVIPAWSTMWAINPQAMYAALNARQRESKEQYINDVLATNTAENVVVPIAYAECIQAQVAGITNRQRELYKFLTKQYPQHPLTVAAKLYLNPDRKIQTGKAMPKFSMIMSGSASEISSSTFKGTRTLIDIRTDHCGVCDDGFAKLAKEIKSLDGKPIRVVSLSIGDNAVTAKEERTKSVTIQYARAIRESAHEDKKEEKAQDLKEFFEYVGYPWRILLSEDLEILAVGNDLDNDHWRATLQRLSP